MQSLYLKLKIDKKIIENFIINNIINDSNRYFNIDLREILILTLAYLRNLLYLILNFIALKFSRDLKVMSLFLKPFTDS